MPRYRIHLTTHLSERGRERNFTETEALERVNDPDLIIKEGRRDLQGGLIRKFRNKFPDGTTLEIEIVAAIKGEDCYVKTGYWYNEESFR